MTFLLALTACVLTVDTVDKTIEADGPLTGADLHVSSGTVTVDGDAEATGAIAEMSARFSGSEPSLSHDVDADGVFSVESICQPELAICEITADVTLPEAISLKVLVDSGDLDVRAMTGALDLETGSGDVDLDTPLGDTLLATGSGNITVKRATAATLEASTGSGEITVGFTVAPTKVKIGTGSGDVELSVPAGSYALSTDVGSGEVHVDDGIVIDASSPNVLDLSTGSGDIRVQAE